MLTLEGSIPTGGSTKGWALDDDGTLAAAWRAPRIEPDSCVVWCSSSVTECSCGFGTRSISAMLASVPVEDNEPRSEVDAVAERIDCVGPREASSVPKGVGIMDGSVTASVRPGILGSGAVRVAATIVCGAEGCRGKAAGALTEVSLPVKALVFTGSKNRRYARALVLSLFAVKMSINNWTDSRVAESCGPHIFRLPLKAC